MATVTPGACSSGCCPAPTEIDCIMVDKVYASCSQTVTATQLVNDMSLPSGCIPSGTVSGSLACSLDLSDSTCSVGAVVSSGTDDINNITYTISAVVNLTCSNGVTTAPVTVFTTTTVPLYNPSGTTPVCTILSGSCSAVILPNGQLSVQVTLCLLLQTLATVQLLVPSYGYCAPSPCEVAASAICPPSNLFPPQS